MIRPNSERPSILRRGREFLEARPVWTVELVALLLIVLLGAADIATGRELAASLFYLAPVTLVAWVGGRRAARMVALTAGLMWLGAELYGQAEYTSAWIQYWNAAVRTSIFLIVGAVMAELRESFRREQNLALTDALTGAANPRQFEQVARIELERARRYHRPISVLYMDCDDFKRVNDRFGHSSGDRLLREIADSLRSCVRVTDLVARMGGDEFSVLLPETDADGAVRAGEKISAHLHETARKGDWPVSFSIGVVTFNESSVEVDGMLAEADHLMYEVKNAGKNAVHHRVIARGRVDAA